jgi:type IV pilus assembly protein PilB
VDASEILGTEPRWEALFAALLSVLLRKGLIADWEFIEEFRKV